MLGERGDESQGLFASEAAFLEILQTIREVVSSFFVDLNEKMESVGVIVKVGFSRGELFAGDWIFLLHEYPNNKREDEKIRR